ncbi:MAG: DUF362 domain-containing protein [Desulfobacterales bacterium]|nr:DUF362 domain-containing protein [Desulfobacterales bacterium]
MDIISVGFESFEKSIKEALDGISAHKQIAEQSAILIKPNLINASPHPVTTAPECCKAIIEYIRKHSKAEIVIAEGCGDANHETDGVFENLGYTAMAEKLGVSLIDLNYGPVKILENPTCQIFPKMYLPKIAFDHYIVSVPVLKAHSLAGITGSLKNMMGFAQPEYYSGHHGFWKKAVFHEKMQESIIDLNKYLSPNLSIMDCSIGLADYHLGGAQCDPHVKKIIAGYNPWEVDREAANLLGLNWKNIGHIATGLDKNSILQKM